MARMIDADELIKFFQEMKDKYQEASSDATSDYGITILGKVAKVYENAIAMVNALAEESQGGCNMKKEIELIKRTKQERLAIANTLIDSVIRETSNRVIADYLTRCMDMITSCVELISDKEEGAT